MTFRMVRPVQHTNPQLLIVGPEFAVSVVHTKNPPRWLSRRIATVIGWRRGSFAERGHRRGLGVSAVAVGASGGSVLALATVSAAGLVSGPNPALRRIR